LTTRPVKINKITYNGITMKFLDYKSVLRNLFVHAKKNYYQNHRMCILRMT